nr:VWA domain-containing protein [Edaphobacter sp. 4G125]
MLSLLACFVALTSAALAQSSPVSNQVPEPTTIQSTARLVLVPALVQSAAKETVYSLHANDFFLTDKGVPQKLTLDEETRQPLSLVVLMQTGGAAPREFDKYRGLETVLASMLGGAPNQVSIVNFDSKPEAASPFTSDITQWTDAINHPDPGDSGAAIMDGLKFALNLLAQQPANHRRIILLLSQPQDSGSKTTAKEIARITGETNTTIYSLVFSPQQTRLKNAWKEIGGDNKPITLPNGTYSAYFHLSEPLNMVIDAMKKDIATEVATLSGGETVKFGNQGELENQLMTIDNHIRNRYILSFTPTSSEVGFHPIQVRLPQYPSLNVSARTGYWLSGPSDSSQK